MAYDPNKEKPKETQNEPGGHTPYSDVLTGVQATMGVAPIAGATAQAPASALPNSSSGPTSTGHVNFDQVYNANADVSRREAGKRVASAESAAEKAKSGLTGAQQGFATARTGASNVGPSNSDYGYASGAKSFYTQPGDVQGGFNAAGQFTKPKPADPTLRAPTEGEWRDHLKFGSKKGYTGPDALSDVAGYDKLLQDTIAAEQQAQNPLTGLNQTDAALLGASGRRDFEDLGAKYGNLTKDLEAANDRSALEGQSAAGASKAGRNAYSQLLGEYDSRPVDAGPQPTRIGSAHDTLGPESGSVGDQLGKGLGSPADYDSVYRKLGLDPKKLEDKQLLARFITSQDDWRMLFDMTPEEAEAWLAAHREESGF